MITPNFDRRSNHNPNARYSSVVFGASYLTELDLNEMQDILGFKVSELISIISKGNDILVDYSIAGLVMNDLIAVSKGEIIRVDSLDFTSIPVGHSCYLDITPTIIKHTSTVAKNGYLPDGTVINKIPDPLFPDVETSRREQLVIKLVSGIPGSLSPSTPNSRLLILGKRLASSFEPVTRKPLGGGVTAEDFATTVEAEAGTSNAKVMTPLRTSEAITKRINQLPTSYPANGGNADTLDDLHGSDLTRYIKLITTSLGQDTNIRYPYLGDADPTTSVAMGLENEWHHIIYIPHANTNGYGLQIAVKFNTSIFRFRNASGTSYNAWNTLSTTAHGHANKLKGGTGSFAGTGKTTTIAHGMGVQPTSVTITPNVNPTGSIGEYGVTFDATNIYVYNTGIATSNFCWLAINNF